MSIARSNAPSCPTLVVLDRLRRELGISQKMLSQTLKGLERDAELGRTLASTVDQLRVWSEMNIAQVVAAQERYDAAREDTHPGA